MLGDRFELLHSIAVRDQAPTLAFLMATELRLRIQALNEAVASIESFENSIRSLAIVFDTSVLMAAGPRVAQIGWDDVVDELTRRASFIVPIRVVEELDGLKDRGTSDQRGNARHALKWLDSAVGGDVYPAPFPPEVEASDGDSGRPPGEGQIRVWVDEIERVAYEDGDRDIIDRSLQLKPYADRVVLVSTDYNMVFRAKALTLDAVRLKHEQIPQRATS